MRTMKAIVTGMSAATLAMIMACGMGTTADAAGATFDASAQTMTATTENGVEVMVSFDAIKEAKGVKTWNTKAKWDVYSQKEATVDLSTLKVAKDMYVAVKDNTADTPNVYHISPDTTKLAGKYEVADKASKLTFTDNKVATTAALEYRTENASKWSPYNANTFKEAMAMYEQQGATLYFRKKAVGFKVADPSEEETAPADYIMNEVTGSFATKEVKVKVTKMANAPAATIDYDQGAFKLKKGSEYRFIINGEFVAPTVGEDPQAGDFTAVPDTDLTVKIKDITKDGIFEVRTAADKKVASKIAVYAYKKVAKPTTSTVVLGAVEGDEENEIASTIPNKGLAIIYGEDKKGNTLTFKTTNADVSYIVYTEDPAANAKAKPLVTLKQQTGKVKPVVVAESKAANGTYLYVVTASDKKTETFRSPALKLTIAYPGAEEEPEE